MSIKFGEDGYTFGGVANTFGGQRTYVRAGRQFMPLQSIKAFGRFYGRFPFGNFYNYGLYGFGYCIFQRRKAWHGILCIKEKYYKPSNEPSVVQLGYRGIFADGVSHWQNLDNDAKEVYNNYTYPYQMSGYNRFLHYYLRDHLHDCLS